MAEKPPGKPGENPGQDPFMNHPGRGENKPDGKVPLIGQTAGGIKSYAPEKPQRCAQENKDEDVFARMSSAIAGAIQTKARGQSPGVGKASV